jgi:hypothetical protein
MLESPAGIDQTIPRQLLDAARDIGRQFRMIGNSERMGELGDARPPLHLSLERKVVSQPCFADLEKLRDAVHS